MLSETLGFSSSYFPCSFHLHCLKKNFFCPPCIMSDVTEAEEWQRTKGLKAYSVFFYKPKLSLMASLSCKRFCKGSELDTLLSSVWRWGQHIKIQLIRKKEGWILRNLSSHPSAPSWRVFPEPPRLRWNMKASGELMGKRGLRGTTVMFICLDCKLRKDQVSFAHNCDPHS